MPFDCNHIISLIQKAFSDVPYPGDDNIIECGYIPRCEECTNHAMAFLKKDWRSLSLSWLTPRIGAIHHFTKAAYKYYIPGYMISVLRDIHNESIIKDEVLYSLGCAEENPDDKTSADNFNTSQLNAIVAFLKTVCRVFPNEDLDCIKALSYYNNALGDSGDTIFNE